jgi:hypothetical protein
VNQRWLLHRDSYRPAGEVIDTRRFEVAEICDDATAKSFVLQHHYSGTYPAARFRFGIYGAMGLAGVAVFSVPCNDAVLTSVFPCEPTAAAELGRFVLLDHVPGNGETWFLGRCFELLRRGGLAGVVSFSDPTARTGVDGATVFGGHVGTIYQAHNAVYLGRGTPRTLRILPDGSVLSDRAIAKLRAGHRGWRYAAARLIAFGAEPPPEAGDELETWTKYLRGWADRWIPRLTRPLRHRGNHKYAWALDRSLRRHLPASLPYPKELDRAAA